MRREVSDERFKAFHDAVKKYYNWDIVLRETGITQVSDKGDQYAIPCPLHEDWDPSMRLNKELGAFHCFSCGAKGGYVKFLWLLGGKSLPYSEYCEQILKSNASLQQDLQFNSLFVTNKSLDPSFNRRRVFDRKSQASKEMPMTLLHSRVKSISDSWEMMVLSLTLLQQGLPADNVYNVVKRRYAGVKEENERIKLMDLINSVQDQ